MTAIKTRESWRTRVVRSPAPRLPRLGWRGGLRYHSWTQLTSMRTALILLFALALAAIPGSLVPHTADLAGPRSRLHQRTPHARPDLRQGRAVRGLQLAMVLRDLPAALRLPSSVASFPGRRVRQGAASPAPEDTTQPRKAARVRQSRDRRSRGRPSRTAQLPSCAGGITGSMPIVTALRRNAATCARLGIWCFTSAWFSCSSGSRSARCSGSAARAW